MWLLIITLVPSLTVLAVASWAGSEAANLLGVSGSWSGVTESGRELINEAEERTDPELRAAAARHRDQLSTSLTQASRWEFVGRRMRTSLPFFFLALAIIVAGIALLAARRMARSVSRPIRELVEWSGMLGREQPLPAPVRREAGEVKEIQALRNALRRASGEISSARARALETERTKSWGEMARRVAHEMKNPLTPLRLASHRLRAIAAERPELAEPISVIAEETLRLEELAARFALLGRPAEGPRAAIDVADLLQRLIATDVPAALKASLAVESSYPFAFADYNSLMQVFRNLVRNAVEASHANENAALWLTVSDDDGSLVVTVADNGRGFGSIALENIFEPDFTSKAHGTGLGLAIAKQIISAHSGEITATARAAGGAEFVVRLPRSKEEAVIT
ncbi:MAG: sensor histidine kinase [Gemmatimonadota bacterium]